MTRSTRTDRFVVDAIAALICASACLVSVALAQEPALAQESAPVEDQEPRSPRAAQPRRPTAAERRERQTLDFVREHQPELIDLLTQLKQASPTEYDQAIRELSQTKARLDQLEARNVERYELELQLWQAKSAVQLLAARAAMSGDDGLRDELRAALERQLEVRLAVMEFDRDAAITRAKTLTDNIEKIRKSRDRQLDRQLEALEKGITKSRGDEAQRQRANRPNRKPAPQRPDE